MRGLCRRGRSFSIAVDARGVTIERRFCVQTAIGLSSSRSSMARSRIGFAIAPGGGQVIRAGRTFTVPRRRSSTRAGRTCCLHGCRGRNARIAGSRRRSRSSSSPSSCPGSASPGVSDPGDTFEDPARERHVPGAPDVPLLVGPGVDRAAVANQLEQARFAEVLGRPLVEALQPRRDHGVVEQPAETLFVGDVPVDVVGRADSGSGSRGGARGTRRPSRAGDRRARGRAEPAVPAPDAAPRRGRARRDAHQRDVHEEALRGRLCTASHSCSR